jgi:hypothetical protein
MFVDAFQDRITLLELQNRCAGGFVVFVSTLTFFFLDGGQAEYFPQPILSFLVLDKLFHQMCHDVGHEFYGSVSLFVKPAKVRFPLLVQNFFCR